MGRILYPLPPGLGTIWTVDPVNGSDSGDGTTTASVGGAVGKASPGDTILITPGTYVENVVIPSQKPGLTLIGVGTRHGGNISPASGVALTVNANDTTIDNLDLECDNGGTACVVVGNRFRAFRTKFEAGAVASSIACQISPNGNNSGGADGLYDDCEFAWADHGLLILGTGYGAVTELEVRNCRFHNLTVDCMKDAAGGGGTASITFRSLHIHDCQFYRLEDGTEPTKYLLLSGSNSNKGTITNCSFATATNATGVLSIGTGVQWVANRTVAGVSTAAPS